jgi:hypothetical protein
MSAWEAFAGAEFISAGTDGSAAKPDTLKSARVVKVKQECFIRK